MSVLRWWQEWRERRTKARLDYIRLIESLGNRWRAVCDAMGWEHNCGDETFQERMAQLKRMRATQDAEDFHNG